MKSFESVPSITKKDIELNKVAIEQLSNLESYEKRKIGFEHFLKEIDAFTDKHHQQNSKGEVEYVITGSNVSLLYGLADTISDISLDEDSLIDASNEHKIPKEKQAVFLATNAMMPSDVDITYTNSRFYSSSIIDDEYLLNGSEKLICATLKEKKYYMIHPLTLLAETLNFYLRYTTESKIDMKLLKINDLTRALVFEFGTETVVKEIRDILEQKNDQMDLIVKRLFIDLPALKKSIYWGKLERHNAEKHHELMGFLQAIVDDYKKNPYNFDKQKES